MATVLLAVGDSELLRLCKGQLTRVGHDVLVARRPLQALDIANKLRVNVLVADDTVLGRDATSVAVGMGVLGLGLAGPRVHQTIELPVVGPEVVNGVEQLAPRAFQEAALALDSGRRVARANGREVALTRSEYQLLDALLSRSGGVVLLEEAMETLWGAGDWSRNLSLLRAHMRNLRLKLAQVGLANAIRSRRGKGYALAV
jgi:DNA-binding response OmpR family regulator